MATPHPPLTRAELDAWRSDADRLERLAYRGDAVHGREIQKTCQRVATLIDALNESRTAVEALSSPWSSSDIPAEPSATLTIIGSGGRVSHQTITTAEAEAIRAAMPPREPPSIDEQLESVQRVREALGVSRIALDGGLAAAIDHVALRVQSRIAFSEALRTLVGWGGAGGGGAGSGDYATPAGGGGGAYVSPTACPNCGGGGGSLDVPSRTLTCGCGTRRKV